MLLGAAYVVVRQVVMRVEMDETVKKLGDDIRAGNATSEVRPVTSHSHDRVQEYFELGAVLIRKKLYLQAIKNLEKSISLWEDEEVELAQVYNAIGYCYFCLKKDSQALKNYKKAVELRPSYVSAWNNLGDVYERTEQWKYGYVNEVHACMLPRSAYRSYTSALKYDSDNTVASERAEYLKGKLDRLGIPA